MDIFSELKSIAEEMTLDKLDEQRGFKNKATASKGGSRSGQNRWDDAYRKLNVELEKAKKAGDTKKVELLNKKKDDMMDKKYPMGEDVVMKEQVQTMVSEASQALINKIRELSGGRVPTGAAFRELKKRAQEELKKEKTQKKAEPKKEKEVSKTSKGKTYTGSADPSDKNIIMQLRKAQDVDGNMDIRISPERTTRLKKSQIDTLLKQHDAITKPRDKRMFIAKLTQALRKK